MGWSRSFNEIIIGQNAKKYYRVRDVQPQFMADRPYEMCFPYILNMVTTRWESCYKQANSARKLL